MTRAVSLLLFLLTASMASAQTPYTPCDWYWIVAGDKSRAWHSGAGSYVPANDARFMQWKERIAFGNRKVTPSTINSEVELYDVIARGGCPDKAPATNFTAAQVIETLLKIDEGKTKAAFGGTSPTLESNLSADDPRIKAAAESMNFRLRGK